MGLISIPFVFTAGNTIIASQHNSNFSTIYNVVNGGLDTTNLSPTAGVLYSQINLGGNVTNSDIASNAAITGTKIASIGGYQLTGTASPSFLATGTAAPGYYYGFSGTGMPAFVGLTVPPVTSNVLFQYAGCVDAEGTTNGEILGTVLTPTSGTANYRFFITIPNASTIQVWSSYFQKVAGINTVTIATRIWGSGSTVNPGLSVNIGGQTGSVNIGTSNTSPTWTTFTISVSGLTNGTFYNVTAGLTDAAATGLKAYCANIIGFGS